MFLMYNIISYDKKWCYMRSNYNNDIYKMYEEEHNQNKLLIQEINDLKLTIYSLKLDLKSERNKLNNEIEKAVKPILEENRNIKYDLNKAYEEINRLKNQVNNSDNNGKNYLIDKLNNQVNKDSSNSSISTSKEIKSKRRTNTYNHRKSSSNKTGGQLNHKGDTLTKEKVQKLIKENNIKIKIIKHKIDSQKYKKTIVKYKIGIEVKPYIEEHIFIPSNKVKEKLPKKFYSDVTYNNDLKSMVVLLGNYCSLPYNKITEIISNFSNNIVNLSEGTIDNIYEDFSSKCEDTILNITTNLLNSTYQHTDETVTSENGKDTYYRGYANKENVLYKYHHKKGDNPIIEDGILKKYFGTLITDHDTGMFKYGTNNQDCIIHFGRYCIEQEQNILVTSWQMKLYDLLLKFEKNRKILIKFGVNKFNQEEIKLMEKEYDTLLKNAKEENKLIQSSYWREKAYTLLNRCIKYKKQMLFYIYDFSIDYDNNFMERALRMIKSKTKVSGGFRSYNGGLRFGNIMSIIKTSKLRNINPFNSIQDIMSGKILFA